MPSGQSVTEEGAVGSVSDRGRCRRVSQSGLNLPRSPGDPPVRPPGREPAGLRWCWECGVRWCLPRPVRVNMVSAGLEPTTGTVMESKTKHQEKEYLELKQK